MVGTDSKLDDWNLSYTAEVGDRVRLIRSLKLWRYTQDADLSFKSILKRKEPKTEDRVIPVGSIGKVLEVGSFLGHTHFRIIFPDSVIVHDVREYNVDPVIEED